MARCVLLLLAMSATVARAQGPITLTQRGLTDPQLTLRIDAAPPDRALLDSGRLGEGYGLRLQGYRNPDNVILYMGLGVALAFTDSVELGIKVLPLRLTDDPAYLDLETYLRIVFFRTRRVQIGGQLVVQVPTFDDFGIGFGVPMLFRLHERVRLDIGIELELVLEDQGPDDDDLEPNLDLPVALYFNVTQRFFFGIRGGFTFYDFNTIEVPVGGFVGYTVGRRALGDLTAGFIWFAGETARDWELMVGAAARFGLR